VSNPGPADTAETELAFTGERLHAGSELFGVDLARHRSAYAYAAELSNHATLLVGVDRVRPDRTSRKSKAAFLRADIAGLPLQPDSFDVIVSFQVIEHLEDPAPYLAAIARLLRPNGVALITTPNLLTSDKVNPFHVHEYESEELRELLSPHFGDVQMQGVGMTDSVRAYNDARLAKIESIMRFDILGMHRWMPRSVIDFAFGQLARVVRRSIQPTDGPPDVSLDDFPVGDPQDGDIDLLGVCRAPRTN
jgi:SAM-dependent methyltransferase